MTVFVDTSAVYALLDRDDAHHGRANAAWPGMLQQRLLTNNYVLVETCALLQRRLGVAALRAFQEDVVPLLQVVWISEQQHRTAMDAVLAAARKQLSLVDCVSFQTMREHAIRVAYSFDRHFREQGFQILP